MMRANFAGIERIRDEVNQVLKLKKKVLANTEQLAGYYRKT